MSEKIVEISVEMASDLGLVPWFAVRECLDKGRDTVFLKEKDVINAAKWNKHNTGDRTLSEKVDHLAQKIAEIKVGYSGY